MKIISKNDVSIKALEILFESCFEELEENDEKKFDETNGQSLREWFAIDDLKAYQKYAQIIIAEEEGNLLGAVIVGKHSPLTWPDGKKCEIFNLGVLPEYRNRGIGRKLMEAAEKEAQSMGGKSIILNVHEIMVKTHRFYENLGYKKIGKLENYYDNGSAVFFMKRI
ncbi:MAG: GNAT family N-acetyltransferase [Candidatus Dojkabacteria bacterium]|nr:GNAT family N-acetyltransferase [Candidatus Dojkabacteria bacterium]